MQSATATLKRGTARQLGIRQPCPCMAIPNRIQIVFDPSANYETAMNCMLAVQYQPAYLVTHVDQALPNRHICHGECSTNT